MTTTRHTPLAFGGPLTSAAMESPLSQLDTAIIAEEATRAAAIGAEEATRAAAIVAEAAARLAQDNLILSSAGSGGWASTLDGTASSGQKIVPVASTTGAVAGMPVYLGLTSGTHEVGVIDTISAGVSVTLVTNLTGTYAAGTPISATPAEVADARDGETMLEARLARDLGGRVLAYDEFDRYADGALDGETPIVGPDWAVTGTSPITIQGGKATANGTSTGYAYLSFAEPVHHLACVVVFSGTNTFVSGEITMAWAGASGSVADLLHANMGGAGFSLTLRKESGSFLPLGGGKWRKPCLYDGITEYRLDVFVRRDSLTIVGPNGEVFSVSDPRIATLAATQHVFWEPVATATGRASLVKVLAIARPDEEIRAARGPSPLDLAMVGREMGLFRSAVGGSESFWQVTTGQDAVTGMPSISFNPASVRTSLIAAVAIGAGTITTHEPLLAGTTTIGMGSTAEVVTVTGVPNPLPGAGYPYVATLSGTAAKVHAVGDAVIGAGATASRLQWNPYTSAFELSSAVVVTGALKVTGNVYDANWAKVVAARRTGWTAATGTATRTAFATTTVTHEELAQRVKALLDDLIAHGLIGS